MTAEPWTGDWRARVYARVRARGSVNVSEFLRQAPTAPYRALSAELGEDVAPIQLEMLAREEAEQQDDLGAFARDCLVRQLHQNLPEGWGRGNDAAFRTARAFGSWSAALGESHRENVDRVWENLQRRAAPGWLPQGSTDPLLDDSFRDLVFARDRPDASLPR